MQATIRVDCEKFLEHYFPGKAEAVTPENTTLWEDYVALQKKFEVARKRLFELT